jgi:hypothetical protein
VGVDIALSTAWQRMATKGSGWLRRAADGYELRSVATARQTVGVDIALSTAWQRMATKDSGWLPMLSITTSIEHSVHQGPPVINHCLVALYSPPSGRKQKRRAIEIASREAHEKSQLSIGKLARRLIFIPQCETVVGLL